MHRSPRIAALFSAVVMMAFSLVTIRPASAEALFIGACLVLLRAAFAPAAGLIPTSTEITISDPGHSWCITNAGSGALHITGTLYTDPVVDAWGCIAGIATGPLNVAVDVSDFPDPTTAALAVNAGSTVHIEMNSAVVVFDGVADLVQRPSATIGCAGGTAITSTDWFGSMVFQDPKLVAA
jgi:hypothetical protein